MDTSKMGKLSIEQEFSLQQVKEEIKSVPLEQLKERLVAAIQLGMERQNFYNHFLKTGERK